MPYLTMLLQITVQNDLNNNDLLNEQRRFFNILVAMCIIVNVHAGTATSDPCHVENEVETACTGILSLVKNSEAFSVYSDEVFIGHFERQNFSLY